MYPPVFAAPFWLGMIASTIFPASVTPATIPLAPAISQNAPAPIRAELIPYYVLPKTEAGVDKIREVLRAIVKHAPESIQEIPRPSREIGSKFQGVLLWKFRGTNGEFEQLRNVLGNDVRTMMVVRRSEYCLPSDKGWCQR